MLDIVKRLFEKSSDQEVLSADRQPAHDSRLAVCALCIEMARIDENFTREELEQLLAILKEKYHLPADDANALITAAEQELDESIDLWQFARLINENYTTAEKIEIIEFFWKIVFVDGKMDAHEHYLMNQLSSLLRLSHPQLIEAKLKVLRSS